jgi:hypothetical protein
MHLMPENEFSFCCAALEKKHHNQHGYPLLPISPLTFSGRSASQWERYPSLYCREQSKLDRELKFITESKPGSKIFSNRAH